MCTCAGVRDFCADRFFDLSGACQLPRMVCLEPSQADMRPPWSLLGHVVGHCEPILASLKLSGATVVACLLAVSMLCTAFLNYRASKQRVSVRLTARLEIANNLYSEKLTPSISLFTLTMGKTPVSASKDNHGAIVV